jgi:cysteinyl-tRNA synthetase
MMIYNTLTRKKEEFKPIKPGYIGLYTCGITAYQYAHIGNLRTYTFEDLLKRTLLYNGYKVRHVMNVTDVGHLTSEQDEGDDKLDVEAKTSGRDVWQIAEFYTEAFFKDINKLNILKPDIICKATDHIKEQIELIETLLKKEYAYKTKEAIYFDTSKLEDYGKLAGLKIGKRKSRTTYHAGKKNKQDFALWFFLTGKHKNHIMRWDSPWDKGFPG